MDKYSLIFKTIHFLSAFLVFTLLILGFYMLGIENEEQLILFYNTHKSLGVIVFALVLLRIGLRVSNDRPDSLSTHTRWEKSLSRTTHWSLYFLMLTMPISGWIMSNAAGFSVPFFGMFELPDLIDKNDQILPLTQLIHKSLALILLSLLALHLAGTIKHHFLDRDDTLKRMTSVNLGLSGGSIIAILTGILWVTPLFLWVTGTGSENATHSTAHGAAQNEEHIDTEDTANHTKSTDSH